MDSVLAQFTHLDNIEAFLMELSDLSRKHEIGINEHGVFFVMEPIDMQLTYALGKDGNITFS